MGERFSGEISIEVVRRPGKEHVAALARLVPQLSSAAPPDLEALGEIVSGDNRLLLARLGGEIVGTLTLVVFVIPTGTRAVVEDVVVDDAARGRGVAGALVRHALDLARARGARTVDLTSRPSREAANHVYVREGFVKRDTHVYRYSFEDDRPPDRSPPSDLATRPHTTEPSDPDTA